MVELQWHQESKWITGPAAREDVQKYALSGAIITEVRQLLRMTPV